MNGHEFEDVFNTQVDWCRQLLLNKAAEYAEDDDRLHNFTVAAELQGISREEALGGMMCKHTVSIYDMIREGANQFSMEKWEEKITDHINYLILLRALVTDELEQEQAEALDPIVRPADYWVKHYRPMRANPATDKLAKFFDELAKNPEKDNT